MTTATTPHPDVATTLGRLEEEFAADPTDVVGDRIVAIRGALATLLEVEPKLAQLTTWRAYQDTWRKALCDELFDVPSPIRKPLDRARYRSLELSIHLLDRGQAVLADTGSTLEGVRLGQLMRETGYEQNVPPPPGEIGLRLPWLGSIPEVDRKIADLTARRNDAQARLDAALADAVL